METVDSVTRTILRTIPDSLAHKEIPDHTNDVLLDLMGHRAVLYLHTIPDSLALTEAQPLIILEARPLIMVDSPVPTVSLAKCLEPLPELMKVPKLLS